MQSEKSFIQIDTKPQSSCNTSSKIINLISLPLIIYALVLLCYIGLIPLNMQIHSLILIGFVFLVYLFFVKNNAYYVACKFKTLYHDVDMNLQEYAKKNALTIGNTTKANGSIDDFLQDYTSNLRNSNYSNIASGIFPTLGILGTFISIAISMPDFAQNQTGLEIEINKLLGGVATAFYVSIYGIFLSIWWTFFEKFGVSRFENTIYRIKEENKNLFWTRVDIESIHIKSNLDNFTKMKEVFETLTSNNILESINSSLEARFVQIERLLQKEILFIEHIDASIKSSQNLTNSINQTTQNVEEITQNFDKLKDRFNFISQELNQNVASLNLHMTNLSSDNLKAIYGNIIKSIETMKADMEKIEWKFTQGLENYETSLKTSLELIDSETSQIIENLTEFKELNK